MEHVEALMRNDSYEVSNQSQAGDILLRSFCYGKQSAKVNNPAVCSGTYRRVPLASRTRAQGQFRALSMNRYDGFVLLM